MTKVTYTPMMTQYLEIKEKYQDTLIFFRLGDFYEMFFEDAKTASKELELVLTGRVAGAEERVPMCGVPHHSVGGYIERLIEKGYKVGIVEQLEEAGLGKGIVKRDVVQVITPGTLMKDGLDENNYNYIISVDDHGSFYALSYCDLSTGEIGVVNCEHDLDTLINEINSFEAKEIVLDHKFDKSGLMRYRDVHNYTISFHDDNNVSLEYEGILQEVQDIRQMQVLSRLISYLIATQKRSLNYLQTAKVIRPKQFLQMDSFTRLNLELTRTIRSENRFGSLLWVLDKTKTAMGARLLKNWIIRPLANLQEIEERLRNVDTFCKNFIMRSDIGKLLNEVYDLPRLIARIGYGNANARDLIQLGNSLKVIPQIKEKLEEIDDDDLSRMAKNIDLLSDVCELIHASIIDEPPFSIKEGGIIKENYHDQLDEIKYIAKNGKNWIAAFETSERERTGIKSLKVGYNRIFGFYIEITKSYLSLVREDFGYERKQTLSGAERFITKELKDMEEIVLNAEDKSIKLEYEIFLSIRDEIKRHTLRIQKLSEIIAYIDVIRSLGEVAVENHFVKPLFNQQRQICVIEGRHPVIEKVLKGKGYIPNDVNMDDESFLQIISGPNMGGKSTYMRQVALCVIMSQIGSFVPCSEITTTIFDKLFTRIGASDDLVSGQSTFMVEMLEANHALRNATPNSLIIFDEIGRGTSTYDGMALAQAIIEFIAMKVKAKTLFSTHYHELTTLENKLQGLKNKHVEVYEENDAVTFLYKLKDGPANKSYGINVARLAHLPDDLLIRAKDILHQLETRKVSSAPVEYLVKQVEREEEWIHELKQLDPLALSPMEALNYLYNLTKKVHKK